MAENAYISQLKNEIDNLKKINDTNTEQIKELKKQLLKTREDIYNSIKSGPGYYLRDDGTIIISAPKIIIGNVDHAGDLLPGASKIIIRGTDVNLQASGNSGKVTTKAPTIKQIAVDPGIDGQEEIAYQNNSKIVSQAEGISLISNKASYNMNINEGALLPLDDIEASSGIKISSETDLKIDAAPGFKKLKNTLQSYERTLELEKNYADTVIPQRESDLDIAIEKIRRYIKEAEDFDIQNDKIKWCINDDKLSDLRDYFIYAKDNLCKSITGYSELLSIRAEYIRKIKVISDNLNALNQQENEYKNSSGGSITISTEKLEYKSSDGDGKLRENAGAGFFITAPNFCFNALTGTNHADGGRLIENSQFYINTESITLNTNDTKEPTGNNSKVKCKSTGKVSIKSKEFRFDAVDITYDYNNGNYSNYEEKIAEKGKFIVNANKFKVDAKDTEDGSKKDGRIMLNSKKIRIVSMDTKKEGKKTKEEKITKDSELVLVSDNVFVGYTEKDKKQMRSSKVQIVSEDVLLSGNNSVSLMQKNSDIVIGSKGDIIIGEGDLNIYSKTNFYQDVKATANIDAPKGTFDEVNVKKKFTSPKIKDGVVGAVPGTKKKKPKNIIVVDDVMYDGDFFVVD